MVRRFFSFLAYLSRHWISALGVILTTTAFVTFLFLELLRISGGLTNAYVGLMTYLLLPTMFVLGLVLIPIGWWRLRRRGAKSAGE